MLTPRRISYAVLVFMLVLAGGLHLGPPLLAILFSYFALSKLLALTKNKWIALILFLVVVAGIACGAGFFTRTAIRELPEVADSSLPSASAWAQARQIELPFTDFDSLKAFVIGAFKEETNYLKDVATFARNATTFIVCVAFTVSLKIALIALIFLIAIHKLEYFLNSKIIGDLIRNPIWLTLLALIIGERLMGIPGMVLAPVILNYLRLEMSRVEVQPER